jgi:hypothetical protein
MALSSRLVAWCLAMLVGPAVADPDGGAALWERLQGERLQIHGFASLTGVKTSANRFFGDSQDGSLDFAEVAINASYQLNPRILFSGQVLARFAGDMSDGTPALDFGLIDLTLVESARQRLGVRLGRLKNPLGLYNETRDVPFTRPSIFLPQVIYFDKVRNLLLSTDGMMIYGDFYTEHGNVSATLTGGQAVVDQNVEWTLLGDDFGGRMRPRGVSWVGSLWYASPQERLRLGLSGVVQSFSYQPAPVADFEAGRMVVRYLILSAQYNTEHWTLSSEYGRLPLKYQNFGEFFPYRTLHGVGYYLQGTYRLRPTVGLVLRYEEGFADRKDQDGTNASALLGGAVPPYDYFAKIWTLGVRWDLNPNLMLRLDYERHQGTYSLATRENDPAGLVKDWDLVALQLAVRF